MPTLTLYLNGLTAGTAGNNPNPEKRGKVAGWSAGAARRNTKWLYSVDAAALDGDGYALSLTMRDTPASAVEFHAARRAFLRRLERLGIGRYHWVFEMQRRGTPHLHLAVYWPAESDGPATESGVPLHVQQSGQEANPESPVGPIGQDGVLPIAPHLRRAAILDAWLAVAGKWGAEDWGQDVKRIDNAVGWAKYLSKHASRGASNYQRAGTPPGWETSGRVWGHGGEWPVEEPFRFELERQANFRFRRLIRARRLSEGRTALRRASTPKQRHDALRSIKAAKQMLSTTDSRQHSEVRGLSGWVPQEAAMQVVCLLIDEGYDVRQGLK